MAYTDKCAKLNEYFSINECRVYKLVHILDTSRCNFTPFLATSTKEFCEKTFLNACQILLKSVLL